MGPLNIAESRYLHVDVEKIGLRKNSRFAKILGVPKSGLDKGPSGFLESCEAIVRRHNRSAIRGKPDSFASGLARQLLTQSGHRVNAGPRRRLLDKTDITGRHSIFISTHVSQSLTCVLGAVLQLLWGIHSSDRNPNWNINFSFWNSQSCSFPHWFVG